MNRAVTEAASDYGTETGWAFTISYSYRTLPKTVASNNSA